MRISRTIAVSILAGLALVAACSRSRSDAEVANEIKARLFSSAALKSTTLDVAVKNGEVTLSGEVPTEATRYEAFKLAAETPGTVKVDDHISVKQALALPAEPMTEPAPKPAPVNHGTRHLKPIHKEEAVPAPAPVPAPAAAAPAPAATPPAEPPKPKAPEPIRVEIPARTTVYVRLIDGIDSAVNHAGESFAAALDAPLAVDGDVVVPTGTDVWLKLVDARSAGHMTGQSELRLELARMEFQGKSYVLASTPYEQHGSSRGKRTAATVGGGAALGALLGGIFGGGKGAAIGAASGAGAGTVVQAATKGQQIRIAPETRLDFRLEQPLEVTYLPEKNKASHHR